MSGARVLVLTGRARYGDPWHDHAATSHGYAGWLAELGHRPVVRSTFPDALDDVTGVDLLLVNSGKLAETRLGADREQDWAGLHDGLRRWVDDGRPLLGVHQAANSFADVAQWPAAIGGRWVVGRSGHPPMGPAEFAVATTHPVTAVLDDHDRRVTAVDERYLHLEVAATSTVLLTTHHDGVDHPVAWAVDDGRRAVYDGTGHDVRVFDSPSRRALFGAEVGWLLGG